MITDLVPVREPATWRSYLNIFATVGRSVGAPVGSYLSDSIGWRWYVSYISNKRRSCMYELIFKVISCTMPSNHIGLGAGVDLHSKSKASRRGGTI